MDGGRCRGSSAEPAFTVHHLVDEIGRVTRVRPAQDAIGQGSADRAFLGEYLIIIGIRYTHAVEAVGDKKRAISKRVFNDILNNTEQARAVRRLVRRRL